MIRPPSLARAFRNRGFTLIEIAIVMVIVMALMGGMIATLSGQMDTRAQAETEQTLADIREALLGFAVAQGRLPCPAQSTTAGLGSGTEVPNVGSTLGGTECTYAWNGSVPGTTLGVGPADPQGYVLDGWGQRIRYAVTKANTSPSTQTNAFTSQNGMSTIADSTTPPSLGNLHPNLYVCAAGNGGSTSDCGSAPTVAGNVVAVIYSTGKNWATGGAGADEAANPNPQSANNDQVFVSHDPAATAGNEFDDQVIWLSPYTLYSRMIAAGKLP